MLTKTTPNAATNSLHVLQRLIQLLCHQMIEYSSSVQQRMISWVTCLLLQLLKHQIHHSDIFRAKRCS